ncbi:MAG TPA: hypothetical protein VFC70_02375 [Oscillospiraceae bacterium]|nr:hypothetical protein [Oscillospiraceae bacterium]
MITIFNRKELCIVFSMKEQGDIREILSKNNIDYYVKTINRMSPSPFSGGARGRRGSFGINMDWNYQYVFYVHKKDYDTARYIIGTHSR